MNIVDSSSQTGGIKRLILDVLKPHKPSIIELSLKLNEVQGVVGISCILNEVDQETENIKVILEGNDIDFEDVEKTIEDCGAVIHSVDGVSAGKRIVEDVETPQDR